MPKVKILLFFNPDTGSFVALNRFLGKFYRARNNLVECWVKPGEVCTEDLLMTQEEVIEIFQSTPYNKELFELEWVPYASSTASEDDEE